MTRSRLVTTLARGLGALSLGFALIGSGVASAEPASDFTLRDIDGQSVSLSELLDVLAPLLDDFPGAWTHGTLATREQSAGRFISNALFVRWQATRR